MKLLRIVPAVLMFVFYIEANAALQKNSTLTDTDKIRLESNNKEMVLESYDKKMVLAIHAGNLKQVKELVTKIDVNRHPENSFLGIAIQQGNPKIVQALIAAGADVNAKDIYGLTPLSYAAMNCNLEKVQILIAAKADVNCHDSKGQTPLFLAATAPESKDQKAVIESLLEARANPNQQLNMEHPIIHINDKQANGNTPLHSAASNGSLEITQSLIRAGANPNIKNKNGLTPLDVAKNMAKSWSTDPYLSGLFDKNKQVKKLERVINFLENYKAPKK